MSHAGIRHALAFLASAYPRSGESLASAETASAWQLCLGDIPDELLRLSVARLARANTWPPAAAEIRRDCLRLAGHSPPGPEEAFAEMERERSAFRWRQASYSHEAVASAVEVMGGLEHISNSWLVDDRASNRARFCRAYEGILARHDGELASAPWQLASELIAKKSLAPACVSLRSEYNRARLQEADDEVRKPASEGADDLG